MIGHFFGGVPQGIWNLSSLTWDQTQVPGSKSVEP